jgi:hypothetical protein
VIQTFPLSEIVRFPGKTNDRGRPERFLRDSITRKWGKSKPSRPEGRLGRATDEMYETIRQVLNTIKPRNEDV